LAPSGNADKIVFVGGYLSGVDPIQAGGTTREVIVLGSTIVAESGTSYIISATSKTVVSHCEIRVAAAISGATAISLGQSDCVFSHNVVGQLATSQTGQDLLRAISDEVRVIGNKIDGDNFTRVIEVTGNDCVIEGNSVNNSVSHVTLGSCGVYINGDHCRVQGNRIHDVGDGTYGGIGIFLNGDHNVVVGNDIESIEGAGIHIADVVYNVVVGNSLYDVGLATITNPLTAAVSNNGIHVAGSDGGTICGNVIRNAVYDGIHVDTGSQGNTINSNAIAGSGNTGITLDATSSNNVCQVNKTQNGVTDNGTSNLVGASTTNNNI
jgi:hypothetical protein